MSYMTGDFPVIQNGNQIGSVHITQDGLLLVIDCTCHSRSPDILRLAAVCRGKYVPLGVMTPLNGALRMKRSFTKNALHSIGYSDALSFHLIKKGDVYTGLAETGYNPAEAAGENDGTAENVPVVYNDFPDPTDYIYDYNDADDQEPEEEAMPAEQNSAPEQEHELPDNENKSKTSGNEFESSDGWMGISDPGILFDDDIIRASLTGVTDALVKEQGEGLLLAVPVHQTEPFPMMPVFCFGSSGKVGDQEYIIFKIMNGSLSL